MDFDIDVQPVPTICILVKQIGTYLQLTTYYDRIIMMLHDSITLLFSLPVQSKESNVVKYTICHPVFDTEHHTHACTRVEQKSDMPREHAIKTTMY